MSHCPNCDIFKKTCKAECCAVVPLNKAFLNANLSLTQRPIKEIMDFGIDTLPITFDMKCVFLTDDLKCKIYDHRPDVCKKFGDETHINMTCPHQTKDGRARTTKEKKKIEKKQTQKLNTFFK